MKPTVNWTRAAVGLFATGIILFSAITGDSIDKEGYRWILGITSVVALIMVVFNKWLWKWPGIRRIIELNKMPPIIHGTWKGEIKFAKDANGSPGILEVYLVATQTLSDVHIRTFVSTSDSYSLTAEITKNDHGARQLIYGYRTNTPHGKRDTNRSTDGMAVLNVIGVPVNEIYGSYFTDRHGSGEIKLQLHSNKIAESFSDAQSLTYK